MLSVDLFKSAVLQSVLAGITLWSLAEVLGCSTPQHGAHQLALEAGFVRDVHTGTHFEHLVYSSHLATHAAEELHVYIEGDGTPWTNGRYPSADPTPRRPLALELMRDDPAPAIYLGRPCYFGLSSSGQCSPEYWTFKRYAPEIVKSMASVIQYYQEKYQARGIVLIGYSGGGTLAMLLSRELQGNVFVLTVAANLDTDLWSEQRGFLPLKGSLNPMDYRADTAQIPQLHLAGLQDEVVPVEVTQSYAATLEPDYFRYYPTFDHSCCWLELWPEIIAEGPWSWGADR
jgi:hypothetical protein